MDLLVALEALGFPAKPHHARALYDIGMRGAGLYPRKGTGKAELFAAADAIVKLQQLVEFHNPDNQENRKQQ